MNKLFGKMKTSDGIKVFSCSEKYGKWCLKICGNPENIT